ncbi:hypothetical protein A8709_05955 [Paenibacillus pectinilyticus]|uniref:ABC-2 type transporter transmembrane domain-containing protein n=1 Tax=Paenibacillus pectinilyticus TaxID=512399 RepID=A0A1C0ZT32_9BACL|nr:ABC transporter permease [Paenibacillus pectinilyticus]OCT11221.1 hypothetical protein A8709_05955 [Paenibacillus pectinilyticus]
MNRIVTVIKFTYMTRFRMKSFRIMSLILIILMSVMIHLPTLINKLSSNEPTKIGVFSTQQAELAAKLTAFYNNQPNADIRIVPLPEGGSAEANEALGKQQIADKKIKGYLEITEGSKQGVFPKMVYKSTGTMEFSLKSKLQTTLQLIKTDIVLQGAGLPDALKADLQTPVSLETVQISTTDKAATGKTEAQMVMSYALVYVMLFLLYMGVIGFGNMVATEITSEKSSRVMELLITSVSPLKQMFGKIIGICLLALTQIASLIAVGAINLKLSSPSAIKDLHLSWHDLQLSLIVYFLIFYLLGFFIYATIFAAVGSLVSRTEDVGQAIMPITIVIVAAFMIAVFGLNQPNAPFVVTMSFVPFFSPLIMFLRIGMSSPPFWQIAISIAIQLISIGAMAWLAAKIYRTGVLMYGKRPSWKELRKAMKAYRT